MSQTTRAQRLRQSSRDTFVHCQNRRLKHSRVEFHPGARRMLIFVRMGRQQAIDLRNRLIGRGPRGPLNDGCQLHAEVHSRKGSPIIHMRLVRRWRADGSVKVTDGGPAKFVFRLGPNAKVVTDAKADADVAAGAAAADAGTGTDTDAETHDPADGLLQTFRRYAVCVVFLNGEDIEIGTIYHRGRLHRLGEDHPHGTQVRREVIDIETIIG